MGLFQAWLAATVVGAGLLATGTQDNPFGLPDTTRLEGPNGSGGNNGLKPKYYHDRSSKIEAMMKSRLGVKVILNGTDVGKELVSTTEGKDLLQHAVGCALSKPLSNTPSAFVEGVPFFGEGFLTTTGGWLQQGLDQQQRTDLHTCLIARMNDLGKIVNIWLGGKNTSQGINGSHYPYSEAVWSVTYTDTAGAKLNVWPRPGLVRACGLDMDKIRETLKSRVCGTSLGGQCGLVVRSMGDNSCHQDIDNHWTCDNAPAQETRLFKDEFNKLHGANCRVP